MIFQDVRFLVPLVISFQLIFVTYIFIFFKNTKKRERELKKKENILLSLAKLEKVILDTLDFKQAVQKIVDSLLLELDYLNLGYKIIVLALIDEKNQVLERISMSQTASAEAVMGAGDWGFHEITIPLSAKENECIKAIMQQKARFTHDWGYLLSPPIPQEESRRLQQISKVETSVVYPVKVKGKVIGVLIFSMDKGVKDITPEEKVLVEGFTDLVGLTVQNSRLYSDLEVTSRELGKANNRLKELDKLKDDFVSVASHELRTPMTAIKSYLWVALNQHYKELSEDMQRYLNRAYISVERLINMVNDMLNISRIEGGRIALRLTETDLVELAREVYDEVLSKANEKNIDVVIVQKNVPKVLCDKDKIHEVLLNLIGNSLKFTKAGGTISVNFTAREPYVTITVADTGVGISQENLKRLFTKFGRLDSSYVAIAESGGTGLGLYISRSLVELHKGQITAVSPGLGKGTTFSFTLPIVGTQIAQELAKNAPKETEQTKELEKTKLYIN